MPEANAIDLSDSLRVLSKSKRREAAVVCC